MHFTITSRYIFIITILVAASVLLVVGSLDAVGKRSLLQAAVALLLVRLGLAAVTQMMWPSYTARMLSLDGDSAHRIVRELGFANLALSVNCAVALAYDNHAGWIIYSTIALSVFFALCGVQHVFHMQRNDGQTHFTAATDLYTSALLAIGGFAITRHMD